MTDLEKAFEAIRNEYQLPALGGVAVVKGKPGPVTVVGVRKAGGNDPALPGDAFHLGSDTKAMTATLLGLFVDEGKVTWKTALGDLFPDLLKACDPAWKSVTLQTVMAHRAGLQGDTPAGKDLNYLHGFTGPMRSRRERWFRERLASPPDATQGTYAYANAGYVLLGMVCERLGQADWETLITTRLWKPLGITGGGFGAPPALWEHALSGGSIKSFPPSAHVDNPPLVGPAGTAYMPMGDWAKFIALHANETEKHLLKPATLEALHTPTQGNYTGGWLITNRSWAGGLTLNHSGSNTLNYCVTWVAPRKRFAALIATNIAGDKTPEACDKAVGELIKRHLTT